MTIRDQLGNTDSVDLWFAERHLTHTFFMISNSDTHIAGLVKPRLEASNARVESWTTVRRDKWLEHQITIDGISASSARTLCGELAQLDCGLKVRVEHLLPISH
jgi:hypothetical protein